MEINSLLGKLAKIIYLENPDNFTERLNEIDWLDRESKDTVITYINLYLIN